MTAYSTVLAALLVWKDRQIIRGAYSILAFFACILGYLIIEDIDHVIIKHVVLVGPLLLPFTFWLFSRSLFNDDTLPRLYLAAIFLFTLTGYYGLYLVGLLGYHKFNLIASHALSVFFVLLALKESLAGIHTDLDDERIKLRKYFTYSIGVLVIITLLVELSLNRTEQESLRGIQRLVILLLNSIFIGLNFSIKSKLLSKRKKRSEVLHPELIEKIQLIMVEELLHRQEKLTIGQLAQVIDEQEYKVRRAINQDLGYRNFLDFINSYRIKEAIDLLKDSSKADLTILEIAYQTGFNSIGPFNRAFKAATGFTPTDYRKKQSL